MGFLCCFARALRAWKSDFKGKRCAATFNFGKLDSFIFFSIFYSFSAEAIDRSDADRCGCGLFDSSFQSHPTRGSFASCVRQYRNPAWPPTILAPCLPALDCYSYPFCFHRRCRCRLEGIGMSLGPLLKGRVWGAWRTPEGAETLPPRFRV